MLIRRPLVNEYTLIITALRRCHFLIRSSIRCFYYIKKSQFPQAHPNRFVCIGGRNSDIWQKLLRILYGSHSIGRSFRLYALISNTIKKLCPVRTVTYVRNNRIAMGHVQTIQYIATITICFTHKMHRSAVAERCIALNHYPLTEPAVTPLMMYLLRQM